MTVTALPAIPDYPLPTEAELPPARVGWTLDPARAVLLVHDLQDHFLDAYGETSPVRDRLLHNVAELLRVCRRVGVPVVYTAQPAQQDRADRALLTDFWGDGIGRRPHRAGITGPVAPAPDAR